MSLMGAGLLSKLEGLGRCFQGMPMLVTSHTPLDCFAGRAGFFTKYVLFLCKARAHVQFQIVLNYISVLHTEFAGRYLMLRKIRISL